MNRRYCAWLFCWMFPATSVLTVPVPAQPQTKAAVDSFEGLDAPELVKGYQDATALADAGKLEQARQKAVVLCQRAPKSSAVRILYASILTAMSKPEQALVQLKQAEALDPDNEVILYNEGASEVNVGNFKAAVSYLQRYLRNYPKGRFANKAASALQIAKSNLSRTSTSDSDYFALCLDKDARRWSTKLMPLKVYIYPGEGTNNFQMSDQDVLKRAFSDWEKVSNSRISFKFVDHPEEAVITCKWTETQPETVGAEHGNTTFDIDSSGNLVTAHITLCTTYGPEGKAPSENDLRVTTLHEVGHALGLSHSNSPDDVMFALASHAQAISARDAQTLEKLYACDQATIAAHAGASTSPYAGNSRSRLARSLVAEGVSAANKNQDQLAIQKYETALPLAVGDDSLTHTILYNIAAEHSALGNRAAHLKHFAEAMNEYEIASHYYLKGKEQKNAIDLLGFAYNMATLSSNKDACARLLSTVRTLGGDPDATIRFGGKPSSESSRDAQTQEK